MPLVQTLISPTEVVQLSNVDTNFAVCSFRTIYNIELYVFRKYLCKGFYDALVDDLIDRTGTLVYDDSTAYIAGNVVEWRGTYYEALAPTTGNRPSVSAFWEVADKFNQAAYNDLWNKHLAEYLSLSVLKHQLPFVMNKIKDEGVLKFDGVTFQAVDSSDEERLFDGVDSRLGIVFNNLDNFLLENDDNTLYSEYKGIKGQCDCDESKNSSQAKQSTARNYYRFG